MAHQPHQEGNDPAASLKMVFVASADVLAAWSSRSVACTDIISFTDSDSKHALDAIRVGRPDMVILEQRFAATARGVAFINELQTDPAAFGTEIRLLSPERTAMIASPSFAGAAPGALGNLAQPIPPRPMRRAQRVRLPDGAEAAIDGQHALLIDVSTIGAQLISPSVLKPNQKVRVVLTLKEGAIRLNAGIAWAAFEMPKKASPYYRAGMEFSDGDPQALAEFYSRFRKE